MGMVESRSESKCTKLWFPTAGSDGVRLKFGRSGAGSTTGCKKLGLSGANSAMGCRKFGLRSWTAGLVGRGSMVPGISRISVVTISIEDSEYNGRGGSLRDDDDDELAFDDVSAGEIAKKTVRRHESHFKVVCSERTSASQRTLSHDHPRRSMAPEFGVLKAIGALMSHLGPPRLESGS